MKLTELSAYWKSVATNNLAIGDAVGAKHFTKYSIEDALKGFKNDVLSPVLAMELPELNLQDGNSDNIFANNTGAVLILKRVAKNDGIEAVQAAYDDMYDLAIEILSKVYNDRRKALQGTAIPPASLVKTFDLNQISVVEVGPVFENHYGWRINYALAGPINLELDESKWDGETKWTF